MSFAQTLAIARMRPADLGTLEQLASAALAAGEEQSALALIAPAATRLGVARLWQWKALLERSLEDLEPALASFAQAARLAPTDAGIAQGQAQVTFEAGLPAADLFERALGLAPSNGEVILGLAAARMAEGRGGQAVDGLAAVLDQAPQWTQGHVQLAQLRSILGDRPAATALIEDGLRRSPAEAGLWEALFAVLLKQEDFAAIGDAVGRGRGRAPDRLLLSYEAIAAAELGHTAEADRLFNDAAASGIELAVWQLRHLIRSGRLAAAATLVEQALGSPDAAEVWPYAALVWRCLADPRADWLSRPELVRTLDLSAALPGLPELADRLRAIHVAKGEYLDQSVRGGTQTDGPLFSRIDPLIRQTRAAVVAAIDDYRRRLPSRDPQHPTLSRPRDRRVRFAGSWSVRLGGGGFHASHVHPQGWISSALYVSLPQPDGKPEAGWLTLGGAPPGLGLDLPPTHRIEPRPGRLVLFPSWMWHGTNTFAAGERLTIAFDVALPA